MDPWCIDKDQLCVIRRVDPLDFVTGRLRFVTHDRDFLSYDSI